MTVKAPVFLQPPYDTPISLLLITEHYYPQRGGMATSCDRIVLNLRAAGVAIDVVHLARKARRAPVSQGAGGRDICWSLGDQPSHRLNLLWNEIEHNGATYHGVVAFGLHYGLIAAHTFSKWLELPLFTCVRGNDFDTAVFDFKKRALVETLYRDSAGVFCVSKDKIKKISRWVPESKCYYTPNGIDLSLWQVSERDRRRGEEIRAILFDKFHSEKRDRLSSGQGPRKIVGVFGQLKEKKGCRFLLETAVKSKLADHFIFLLVGDTEPELEEWLLSVSDHKDWELALHRVPFLNHVELTAHYMAVDVIAIPSFYDGMPNVLLEAGAIKKTVVAANVAGIADCLTHDENALLFSPGNFHDLRSALTQLINSDKGALTLLADNWHSKIQQFYTSDHETESYLKLFELLLHPPATTGC